MAGEWADGGGGSLGLALGRANSTEHGPGNESVTGAKTQRKARIDAKKRPLTARTLLAALARPGAARSPAEPQPQRPPRRPARHLAAAAAASATSRDSSPGRGAGSWGVTTPPGSPADSLQRRLRRLERAKLYLLEQPGPHSFLVATDTPGHKFRVTLGPQSCSCSRPSLCVHLLFVMVRVLRLPATDYRVTSHPLKSHEVEALLQSYRRRRLARASNLPCGDTQTPSDTASEERRCPICQLEMTSEESLVRCEEGCHCFLHHRCMSVWTVEVSARQEAPSCPLCRAAWPGPLTPLVRAAWSSSGQSSAAPLPPLSAAAETAGAVPASHTAGAASPPGGTTPTAAAGPPVFTACTDPHLSSPNATPTGRVSSRSPDSPQPSLLSSLPGTHTAGAASPPGSPLTPRARTALAGLGSPSQERAAPRRGSVEPEPGRSPQLSRRAAGRGSLRRAAVRLERLESVERRQTWSQVLGRDLVHLVFSRDWQIRDTGICRLAEELSRMVESPGGRTASDLVHHIADLLAVLCADPVYKVFYGAIKCLHVLLQSVSPCSAEEAAQLRSSLVPLVDALLLRSADANRRSAQLSAWTLSELCRGPAGQLLAVELDGLQLVLERLLQECRSGADSWQWCLGRLLVADYLLDQFPERFDAVSGGEGVTRVLRLAEFAHRALTHPHAIVSQLAHRVFVQMAQVARAAPAAHAHIGQLLAALSTDVRLRLARRIRGLGGARPARRGRPPAAARAAAPPEQPPAPGGGGGGGGARRPRPNYLPLDSGGGGAKRRCSPLRRPAGADRSASLRARHVSSAAPAAGHHPAYRPPATTDGMDLCDEQQAALPYLTTAHLPVEDVVVHSHNQDMEDGTVKTYTEEVDWQRGPLLGTGAFSSCYQARDLRSGRLMAVKQVQLTAEGGSADEAALLQEVRLLARLQHPHVLRLLGATRRPGLVSLFTEWEAGGSVAGLLEQYGPFDCDVIRRYTCHLVDGLAYLHDNHILHRDLKGHNLLVDSTGETLRIGDLGTAAELGASATLKGEFTGELRGTMAFMAPEVLRGQHYGRSCDVWSVGCCVIEMATGRPPWDAHTCSNHLALLFRIARSETPPDVPHHLPDDLRTFVSDCHRMDGEKRPATKSLLEYPCFKGIREI